MSKRILVVILVHLVFNGEAAIRIESERYFYQPILRFLDKEFVETNAYFTKFELKEVSLITPKTIHCKIICLFVEICESTCFDPQTVICYT